jgi:glucokinase
MGPRERPSRGSGRSPDKVMLLAGDVGGTKTLLGLFESSAARPQPLADGEFVTLDYAGLDVIVETFLKSRGVDPRQLEAMTLGVAGAITDQVAELTNVAWRVDAAALSRRFGVSRVRLLNDLEAMGYAVPVLQDDELAVLQRGTKVGSGNVAIIAAGTGLGEGMLLNVNGRLVPGQSEGGHADFAARTPRELEMVAALTPAIGRVSAENVLSGPGLVNVYRFTHAAIDARAFTNPDGKPSRICDGVGDFTDPGELPPRITASATVRRCPRCVEALDIFVAAYGAEAGNLGLRMVATAGVYVGGGIAPKLLPALSSGLFMEAFRAKPPMDDLVANMPVAVILNRKSGLLGAAVHANSAR